MKRSTLLGLYTDSLPKVFRMVQYQSLVQKRREIYNYIDRYKQLPVLAILAKDTQQEDIDQHYSSKMSAAASSEAFDEFIAGETQIFRLRLEQISNHDINKVFITEYLARLQNKFSYEIVDDCLLVKIDEVENINWLGEVKNTELSQEVMNIYARTKCSIEVVGHFTKYYTIKERIENGFIKLGIDGVKSILMRGFQDLLSNTTQSLYMSGVPKEYIITQPIVSTGSMKLEEKCVPKCISNLLSTLKKQRHLKYTDRSNLNNFLKAAGVPVEDAIGLYKTNFSCSATDFEKKYKYSILHAYGLVGSKIQYKATPCIKIISESKRADCVGCPFANCSDAQGECTKTLEKITGSSEATIVSPSEYYLRAARKLASRAE